MEVLALLRSKNKCLTRFLEASQDFWIHAQKGDLSGLDAFYLKRESILKGIDLYERKINETLAKMSASQNTAQLRDEVRKLLDHWKFLVHSVANIDAKIIEKVAEAKDRAFKHLHENKKSQETLNRFKSAWVPSSGESLDEKL